MTDLILRSPCPECGGSGTVAELMPVGSGIDGERVEIEGVPADLVPWPCPRCNGSGGSEAVLDPTTVLDIYDSEFGELACQVTVADILTALTA